MREKVKQNTTKVYLNLFEGSARKKNDDTSGYII